MVEIYVKEQSLQKAARRFGCSPTTLYAAVRGSDVTLRSAGATAKERGIPVSWKSRVNPLGYVEIYGWLPMAAREESGPRSRSQAVIAEHRLVMEQSLGRPLSTSEQVHHKNGVRHDNRLSNLELRIGNHGSGATHCPHCGLPL